MKITMVAAISKDGYLTDGDDPNPAHWTSKEDHRHFVEIAKKYPLHIMGKTTYDSYEFTIDAEILRVVLTREPEEYKDTTVPGKLEFYSLSAAEFIERYEDTYSSALVLGGASVFHQFIDQGLIDEAYITVEPVLHGSGVALVNGSEYLNELFNGFELSSSDQLNQNGTILHHYVKNK